MTVPATYRIRMLAVGVIAPLVILAAALVVMAWALPELPSPVGVHWGPSGYPDAFGSPLQSFILLPVVMLAYTGFTLALVLRSEPTSRPTVNQRLVLAVGPFLATVLGVLVGGSLVMQRGLADAAAGPSIIPLVIASFGLAALAAVVGWFVLPASEAPGAVPAASALPTIELAEDERAVWTRRVAPSRTFIAVLFATAGLALAGGAIALALVRPIALLVLLIPAVAIAFGFTSSYWRVRIDRRGFDARGALGTPHIAIPIEEVASARAITVDPMVDFGGWGYRWGGRGVTGIIVRGGEALEVRRTNGRVLVVTVANAETGARLLNSLALRD